MKIMTDNHGRGRAESEQIRALNVVPGRPYYEITESSGLLVEVPKEVFATMLVALTHGMRKEGWGALTVDEILRRIGEGGETHDGTIVEDDQE